MSATRFTRSASRLEALRVLASAAVIVGGTVGLSGCSPIAGNAVAEQKAMRSNLENQRKESTAFIEDYQNPNLTAIRFTAGGGRAGFGTPWSINAVVTVEGMEYEEIFMKGSWGGDPLPEPPAGAAAGPVSVTYSDGTSEVLK